MFSTNIQAAAKRAPQLLHRGLQGLFGMSLLALFPGLLSAQPVDWPQTRAEKTEYRETSHYSDVIEFLNALQARGAPMSVQIIGASAEGKPMPLVIVSRPPVANPTDALRSGKVVVYLQANIHAGEVEGKEAALILLRQLAQGDTERLLDKLILLVTPIYNIDGNEKFGPNVRNRPSQDGPEPVGERPNGQGLDLNRDCIKAESPEMRAVLEHVYTAWEPDLTMDLHTTNGTRHGYQLTYSPPLNPNTDPVIMRYAREELLPGLRRRLRREKGLETFDYGNVEGQGEKRGWYVFGEEGRYVTNYVGLRNRIAILSEAASFLPFKTRIDSTLTFVTGVLQEAAQNAPRILGMTRLADERTIGRGLKPENAPPLGVRFAMIQHGFSSIPLEKARPEAEIDHRKAPKEIEKLVLPVYDRFQATRTAKFPAAYLIPAAHTPVIELLTRHGVVVETLKEAWKGSAESFRITERVTAASPFQKHRLNRLEGQFSAGPATLEAGSYLVRTAQPLGVLAFHLLEPEGLDGVAAWNFLSDEVLKVGDDYPIRKVFVPVTVPTERVGRPKTP